jgi:hypothetical protein
MKDILEFARTADENGTWVTVSSHPASRTAYQEITVPGHGTLARVTVNGRETVTPSRDTDGVWKQYHARVQRAIDES